MKEINAFISAYREKARLKLIIMFCWLILAFCKTLYSSGIGYTSKIGNAFITIRKINAAPHTCDLGVYSPH